MNQRVIKPVTALLLSAVLIFSTAGFDSCDKKIDKAEFMAYAKDIVVAFRAVAPIIAQHKPGLLPAWNAGTQTATRLLAAVEANDKTTALEIVAELIPLVNQVAGEFTNNTAVLVSLALADIGLHFFVNHYNPKDFARASSADRGKGSPARTIEEFKARPVWGCQYQPEKCRALKKAA